MASRAYILTDSTAFRVFESSWDRERHINIAGSSIEGFKRGIGIEARELLMGKLEKDSDTTMRILLTHSSVAKYREAQERELDGYIVAQIKSNYKDARGGPRTNEHR